MRQEWGTRQLDFIYDESTCNYAWFRRGLGYKVSGGISNPTVYDIGKFGFGGSAVYYPEAHEVWNLQGPGVAIGGTAKIVSVEMSASDYTGYSAGLANGLEFHALITYTWVIPLKGCPPKGR